MKPLMAFVFGAGAYVSDVGDGSARFAIGTSAQYDIARRQQECQVAARARSCDFLTKLSGAW
jgi:hypothetical protein